jgi:isochorismate pyruvate lyase
MIPDKSTDIANILKPYRAQIDALDHEIVVLLVKRFAVIDQVARIKAEHNIPAVLEDRVREVIDNAAANAAHLHSPDIDLVREIYTLLVTISCDKEEQFFAQHKEVTK